MSKSVAFSEDPDGDLRRKIEKLKANLTKLSGAQIAASIKEILDLGISRRALAKQLSMTEGNIRSYLNRYKPETVIPPDLAGSPEPSPEPVLAEPVTPAIAQSSILGKVAQSPETANAANALASKRIRTVKLCTDEIVEEAITTLKRFLLWEVGYGPGLALQLLEEVRRRIQAAEIYGDFPRPAPPDADPWTVIGQCAPKDPCDIELENFATQITKAVCMLVPESKAREYVLRVLLNFTAPQQYPSPTRVPA